MKLTTKRKSWDQYFLEEAQHASTKSKDPSTQIGVVIVKDNTVIGTGFNGFPRGVQETIDDLRWDTDMLCWSDLIPERWLARPEKYSWVEHAERNALYQAARHHGGCLGATMYFNTRGNPCCDCARGIIQSGIRKIVMPQAPMFKGVGDGKFYLTGDVASVMLEEAGVLIEVAEGVRL